MELFVDGGYPYHFVDNPLDLLICKICHLVSQDPYETTCCNNTFCKVCIDRANQHGFTSCPVCRHQPIQTIKCVQLHRQIESLSVFCDNKKVGCEWVGEVGAIQQHMKQCPYFMVMCEYHIVGCDTMVAQHLLNEHHKEKAQEHIIMVQQKVEELKDTKAILNQANEALYGTKQDLKRNKALLDVATVELEHTKSKLHDITEKLNVSQTELHNTNKQLNETMDQLVRSQEETNDTQRQLDDSKERVNQTTNELLDTNQRLNATEMELTVIANNLKKIKNHVKSNSYEAIKLVALSTKIPSEASVIPTVLKMPQYMEKKENFRSWYSEGFYTDDKGYKMCLRVLPGGKGNGRGTHMSVALCLMEGPHDDYLAWPLRGRFKITLLNQRLKDNKGHSRIITYDNSVGNEIAGRVIGKYGDRANECIKFISHSKAKQFLIDDCMYFLVQTHNITPNPCEYLFKNFCIVLFFYYILLLIGMFLLQ